jgi:hypothetical protein
LAAETLAALAGLTSAAPLTGRAVTRGGAGGAELVGLGVGLLLDGLVDSGAELGLLLAADLCCAVASFLVEHAETSSPSAATAPAIASARR